MSKISAVVITKNEEEKIKDCIESISFCDEIIIVDNNSQDKTCEIAHKMGAKVFSLKSDSFSDLRNFGLEKASFEWILYVDADERVSEKLREEISLAVNNFRNGIVSYRFKRKNFYFGNHEWPYIEKMERLFLRKKLKSWKGKLHESPIFDGDIKELEGFLLHFTHHDLSSMVTKTLSWSEIEAGLKFSNNHPKMTWWRFPRVMLSAFLDSYIKQSGWKAGTAGIIESIYQAFSIFITYARLWEFQNKVKINPKKN
ncbi:MAG: glycosyltransferase family 2 protein [Candidatus Levybacteria bacterium]|nr:glycosyltransferase family 2 protein [Candidatus Levybacteria bacterium]